jgi:hypothetical protein
VLVEQTEEPRLVNNRNYTLKCEPIKRDGDRIRSMLALASSNQQLPKSQDPHMVKRIMIQCSYNLRLKLDSGGGDHDCN